VELPVFVLAEQGRTHARKSLCLQHSEPFLECVVEFDLAVAAEEEDASCSVVPLVT
jgi:hypothetical protein